MPADSSTQTPAAQLERLLVELFNTEELGAFVRRYYSEIADYLPDADSKRATVDALVGQLLRRGLVTPVLFERLAAERPARALDIRRVHEVFYPEPSAIEAAEPQYTPDISRGCLNALFPLFFIPVVWVFFDAVMPGLSNQGQMVVAGLTVVGGAALWILIDQAPFSTRKLSTGTSPIQPTPPPRPIRFESGNDGQALNTIQGPTPPQQMPVWLNRPLFGPIPYSGPEPDYPSPAARSTSDRLRGRYLDLKSVDAKFRAAVRDEVNNLLNEQRLGGQLTAGGLVAEGRFLLVRLLGQGSIGAVWLAWDLDQGQQLALRVFHTHLARDPAIRDSLRRALAAQALLEHPGVVRTVVPSFEDRDFEGYGMEFMSGGSLVDVVARQETPDASLWQAILHVGDALCYAHSLGLTHGSVSPRAILLDGSGRAKIHGFAESQVAGEASLGATRVNVGIDRVDYLAPEALEGVPLTPAADQVGLATTALFALNRAPPKGVLFRPGATDRLLEPFPQLAPALRRALAHDPAERFPSMAELVAALRAATGAGAGPTDSREQQRAPARVNPFSPGNPLRSDEIPPGRTETVEQLLDRVGSRSSAALVGPRRGGKTSLLEHLRLRATDTYRVYKISLESISTRTPDDLARALDPELLDHPRPAVAFVDRLRREEDRWPVLLLDEVGYLKKADLSAEPNVFGWLRGLGQELASVIYAGSPADWAEAMAQAAKEPGSSFGNDVPLVTLGPLGRDAAMRFLETTAPPDVRLPSEPSGRWIIELCGTWPYYLQLMGYAIVTEARRGRRSVALDRTALVEIYERAVLAASSPMFRERWEELPLRARQIIGAAPRALPAFDDLPRADREILSDALVYDGLTGWALDADPPFQDWIARKQGELLAALDGSTP